MSRISDLESVVTPAPTDVMIVSDGVTTKKITVANAKNTFLTKASKDDLGGIRVGSGLDISDTGVLSVRNFSAYVLPPATANTLGGVRVGTGLRIDETSVLSIDYTLPTASSSVLGGVKVGSGLAINNGTLSVIPVDYTRYSDSGLTIGIDDDLRVFVDNSTPTVQDTKNGMLRLTIRDDTKPNLRADISFINSTVASSFGGDSVPALHPNVTTGYVTLGTPSSKWYKVYADTVYSNVTGDLTGDVFGTLIGNLQAADNTIAFSAQTKTFTGNFTGNLTGNATTATRLLNSVNINGVAFNGTSSIVVNDETKLSLNGGILTGALTLSGPPTSRNHASSKGYVDDTVASKVSLTGDTMTGYLTLYADPGLPNHATTKSYVDALVAKDVQTVNSNLLQYINQQITTRLPVAGGTMTGFITLHANPSLNLHAATKQYVDSALNTSSNNLTNYVNSEINTRLPLTGGILTGDLTLNGSPTRPNHATTKQYVDDQDNTRLPLTGGTLTGSLSLSADPVSPLHAATKQYVDSQGNLRLPLTGGTMTGFISLHANPTANLHAATKQYVDTTATASSEAVRVNLTSYIDSRDNLRLPLAGGTMTGFINLHANPTANLHAATKQYVDTAIAGINVPTGDPTKLPLAGGTMTGFITLNANPTSSLHAVPKQYVDAQTLIPTYGNLSLTSSIPNGDVFPPAGKTISAFKAFLPAFGSNVSSTATETINLILAIDISGSAYDPTTYNGVYYNDAFQAAEVAAKYIVSQYTARGATVAVGIIQMPNTDAGSYKWVTSANANANIDAIPSMTGTTNGSIIDAFNARTYKTESSSTVVYFLSDSSHALNLNAGFGGSVSAWQNFLNSNKIVSYGLGMGTIAVATNLNDASYDGRTGLDMNGMQILSNSQIPLTTYTPTVGTGSISWSLLADRIRVTVSQITTGSTVNVNWIALWG